MKALLIGCMAALIAITAFAFTHPSNQKGSSVTEKFYYRYTLTTNTGMTNPQNYVITTDLSGCDGGEVVCLIEAPGSADDTQPHFPLNTNPYSNAVGVSVIAEKQ